MTAFFSRAMASREEIITAHKTVSHSPLRGVILAFGILWWAACSMPVDAREQRTQPAATQTLLQQADAAYADGDRERAQRLYRAVLASDPNNTRAIFQLAQLAPEGSQEAIALLRRYLALEPGDPWGRMALGDALAKSGAVSAAVEQYRHRQVGTGG